MEEVWEVSDQVPSVVDSQGTVEGQAAEEGQRLAEAVLRLVQRLVLGLWDQLGS